jgi:hypothetical protein
MSTVSISTGDGDTEGKSMNTSNIPQMMDWSTIQQKLQQDRDLVIQELSELIRGKQLQKRERGRLNNLRSKLISRSGFVKTMLNQYTTDLAYRRKIVPATRGETKAVVFGN